MSSAGRTSLPGGFCLGVGRYLTCMPGSSAVSRRVLVLSLRGRGGVPRFVGGRVVRVPSRGLGLPTGLGRPARPIQARAGDGEDHSPSAERGGGGGAGRALGAPADLTSELEEEVAVMGPRIDF